MGGSPSSVEGRVLIVGLPDAFPNALRMRISDEKNNGNVSREDLELMMPVGSGIMTREAHGVSLALWAIPHQFRLRALLAPSLVDLPVAGSSGIITIRT